jgi:hypothetical protein
LFDEALAKNWQNINQFFMFWKNLAAGGEYQLHILYEMKIITKFLDFILDKNSPLTGVNSKGVWKLGSQYSSPDYDSLIDTIAIVCSRADTTWNRLNNKDNKVLFKLSENDKKLIYNSELWNLCLGN